MKHVVILIAALFNSPGNALEKKSYLRSILGIKDPRASLILGSNSFDFDKAIKKSWTTKNPDGTKTVWYKDIEKNTYRITNDGIKELYKKQ